MPIQLQPVVRPRYNTPTSGVFTSGDWNWVAQQEYAPDRAWTQIGNNRRGTVKGGPTYTRLLQLGNEEQWAVVPPRPALNEGVLDDEREFYRRQLGALDLNLADPITTMRSLADQAGMATGEDQNPLAWLRGVDSFLQGKDVDPFGTGNSGAPARAADYALAVPILVWNHLSGRNDFAKDPNAIADFSYRFQADPRYWAILHNPETTRQDLDLIARSMVGQFADPDRNGYLVEQIRKQFDLDKAAAEALSSGNDAIDYAAKKFAVAAYWNGGKDVFTTGMGEGWRPLPVIGTQIASLVNPVHADEEAYWRSLTPETRAHFLQNAGMQQMAFDFIGSVPALSGAGTVLMVAKAGQLGATGRALYQTYDWGFKGANVVMSTGLVVATTNWALEAFWPGYEEAIGREIDMTRPISQSNLAGAVNAIGYWSTGTYGALNATKTGAKVVRAVTGKGLPILERIKPSPIGGHGPELELYRTGHGGSRMASRLVSEGLDAQGLSLSQKRLTLSYVSHLVGKHDEEMFSAIVEGQPTGVDAIDELPLPERIQFANEYLARSVNERAARTEMAFRVLNAAKQPDEVFKGLDDIKDRDWIRKNARTIEHLSAGAYLSEYGPAFIYRTTGGSDAAAIEAWVRESFARMGVSDAKLGKRSLTEWEQTLRSVYHYEFDRNVGLMHAAIDAMPTNEASQISLVSARHVFKDEVEDLVAILRGEDEDAARALVIQLIRDKIEVESWYSRVWQPPRKSSLSPELVDPKALAKHLEEIAPALPGRRGNPNVDPVAASLPLNTFHRQLQEDGIWEIAFKPTDENGNFVSYVRTTDGHAFRSPWLDYPMTSVDMVELGNAGLLRSKMDGIFRGFRTYRISEYQRGSLFRNLTGDFDFTASQIDEFHDRVIKAARQASVQPQTLGTVGNLNVAGTGRLYRDEVERIAEDVFGQGPYVNRRGQDQEIDWLGVIARSYRQSLKLNLTAGLTSHMKSRLGSIGNGAAWASDIAYVNVRFNLSPIFKWSEFIESLGFGAMRGAARGDPWTEALFYRYGLGNDFGIVGAEKTYDQMLAGMNEVGRGGQRVELTPQQRQAKGYMWYARNLPEDFEATAQRSMVEGQLTSAEFQPAPEFGRDVEWVPTDRIVPFREIDREVHPRHPQMAPNYIDDLTEEIRVNGFTEPVLLRYDVATNKVLLTDGNHRLAAALRLGLEEIPVQVKLNDRPAGVGAPLSQFVDLPDRLEAPELIEEAAQLGILRASDILPSDKPEFGPIATGDRAELMKQLRQAITERPQPGAQERLENELGELVGDSGDFLPGMERRGQEILDELARLDAEEAVEQADRIEDVFGTPEHLEKVVEERTLKLIPDWRSRLSREGRTKRDVLDALLPNPIPFKERAASRMQIDIMRREFPSLLRVAGMDGPIEVFQQLGIPEREWAAFLLRDRELLQAAQASNHPDDWAALFDWAPGAREELDALYASEDWAVITSMWSIASRTASDDAFRVHFFNPYRSAFERSINHPLLGVYPASWAYKAAREWAKFLFDNDTFHGLHLGMTPVVAINNIVDAQNQAFAQADPEQLAYYVNRNGPFGSSLFIFNLLMPGDWSSIPFPLSRSIRDVLRGNTDPGYIINQQVTRMGVFRDVRLIQEMLGEVEDYTFGPEGFSDDNPWTPRSEQILFSEPRR